MSQLYYLAYGSNLHPLRLTERIPSTRFIGTVSLPGYRVAFHKRGKDESAKCNLLHDARACAHAAVFSLAEVEKPRLDEFEGAGYVTCTLQVTIARRTYACFYYAAQDEYIDDALLPYDWYRGLVEVGARYQGFPSAYIQSLTAVQAISDPDQERAAIHQALLQRINNHPG